MAAATDEKYEYIIAGAGLCGLVLAKELSKKGKKVLVLEKGGFLNKLGNVRRAFSFYDKLGVAASVQGIPVYRAFGVGGTSIISCGNAVEFTDDEYNRIGINFKEYLPEAKTEACVKEQGLKIGRASAEIMDVANKIGINMIPMPKFSKSGKCASCGDCFVGCTRDMKWTSRDCLEDIDKARVDLFTGFSVDKVMISQGKAVGVSCGGHGRRIFHAEKIILSAGGIGTPIILQRSGVDSGGHLFVDVFNITYGLSERFNQRRELPMSVVCGQFHQAEGFVMSPFVDNWYSFATTAYGTDIAMALKLRGGLMGMMTKINDDSTGRVSADGRVDKSMTESDSKKLKKGSDICKDILIKCGVKSKSIFVTKPRGAHPGGTAGIGRVVDKNLETKIKNLYVCDASVLPFAPGLPPMLSLIALTKWFAKKVLVN